MMVPFRPFWSSALAALLLTSAPGSALAQDPARDPMEPTSDSSTAIVSPLRIVTLATNDMVATRRFYQGALGMTPVESTVTGAAAQALVAAWKLQPSDSVTVVTFTRPGVADAIIVRAVKLSTQSPVARPGYLSEYVGALGMGVPVRDIPRRDQIVTAFGFKSVVGVTSMAFPRADKTTYVVGEIHYEAPDNVLVLGVDRADMNPVGPIDPALDIGGPSYSSAIIGDADRSAAFFGDVLGMERRRGFVFESTGPKGGMRLPTGTNVKFEQWFSPGSRTGYLVIMDLLNAGKPAPTPLGLTNAGLGMWSFETPDLSIIERRVAAAKATVLTPATDIDLPGVGCARALVLATPDGFPVEVYQKRADCPK